MGKHNEFRERKGPDERDYDVGYEKPPREHQFKPGQSGNPSGRPKKAPSLRAAAARAVSRTMMVNGPDGPEEITKMEAMFEAQTNQGIKGKTGAAKLVIKTCIEQGVGTEDDHDEKAAIDAQHFDMLMAELERMKGEKT